MWLANICSISCQSSQICILGGFCGLHIFLDDAELGYKDTDTVALTEPFVAKQAKIKQNLFPSSP